MARRRVAEPVVVPGGDPSHIRQASFEHPVFGHVRMWFKGSLLYRVKWSSASHGQNLHTRHNNPEKFAEVLKGLGLND